MNILAIGNSFSEDATRYLYGIARADGVNINVFNLCIGGCPLDSHYRNMLSGERAYELQVNGHKSEFRVSLKEGLLNRSWDIITIQQVSNRACIKESYQPYATALVKFIRECAPKAKIYFQQTWGYETGSPRLVNEMGYATFRDMQNDVTAAYAEAADVTGADGIIPSGEMLGALLDNGIAKVHRDTSHASLGLGRYALALLWYKTLIGKSVVGNTFRDFDEPVWEDQVRIVQQVVESFN